MEDDSSTPALSTSANSPSPASTSVSAHAPNGLTNYNAANAARRASSMTTAQISARNAEISRQQAGTATPIYQSIENDERDTAVMDAGLWTQFMNDG